jgi:uncharacterized membrane protein YkoI
MRKFAPLMSTAIVLALFAGAAPSRAEAVSGVTAPVAIDCALGPREISDRLRGRLPGRMMSIECSGSNYFVMWAFDDGSIGYLTVDGRTGRVISQRRGDSPRRP